MALGAIRFLLRTRAPPRRRETHPLRSGRSGSPSPTCWVIKRCRHSNSTLLVAVDGHDAGSRLRAHQAVLEMLAIWQFDVCNSYIKPVVDIEWPLGADFPFHDCALF